VYLVCRVRSVWSQDSWDSWADAADDRQWWWRYTVSAADWPICQVSAFIVGLYGTL